MTTLGVRLLLGLGLLLGAFLGGWHARSVKADADQLQIERRAAAELKITNQENARVTDELLKDRAAFADAAASSAQRLRNLSSTRSAAATACSRLDEPAAAVLPDHTREAVEREADRADGYAVMLAKLQAYVRNVCKPK